MAIRIVTDSNCDLPEVIIQEYGVTVVPMYINIGTDSYLDGVTMSRREFYEGLPHFHSHPMTSVPGPGTFVEIFDELAGEGATEILCIHISGSLSAMVNSARLAAEEWDRLPVTVFDSGNLTLGTGLQVVAAARAAAKGLSMAEILALLEDQASRTYCFAVLDTVEFLLRSGRLTRFQYGLASVLQIKPLLKMHGGEPEMERVRTSNGATKRLMELTEGLGLLEELALVHTHAVERAEALGQQAHSLFPAISALLEGKAPLSAEVTPVIGTHIGPGAVGFVAIQARRR
ncbi:MAG TPA: DegV family protein [Anaerolineae bacterium]|nr:DegV family protein [Anaerolineae bacterium]